MKILFCNRKGMTLVEILMVVLIMAAVIGGSFLIMSTGQSTWFTTDARIQVQESLRQALDRFVVEMRQTQMPQVAVSDGTGPGGSDIIRFSLPVVCEAGGSLIDTNGDVAHWGAPLTWGCQDSSCMDADDDCSTLEYKYVEYRLNNNAELVRRVLDGGLAQVRENVFASNISDLQAQVNTDTITLTVSAQKEGLDQRTYTEQQSVDVYLRN